jgi:hypothetical protein
MLRVHPLPPRPATLVGPTGEPLDGLWAGDLDVDPVPLRHHRGRVRRWSYAAAGDETVMIGAAVADVGPALVAFVWCFDGMMHTWEQRGLPGLHGSVGLEATRPSRFARGDARVLVLPTGGLEVDVPVAAGRLQARIEVTPGRPAVYLTPTPRGGWNATRKAAGEAATGRLTVGGRTVGLDGGSWRDHTVGRQDRRTTWRWAAGAGRGGASRVGINVTRGMNDVAGSDDVVWWDDVPYRLEVDQLGPVTDDLEGPWRVTGDGWELAFQPIGVRAADENLVVMRSRYVQPVGHFVGALPGPDGAPVEVVLHGVTEDHEAVW